MENGRTNSYCYNVTRTWLVLMAVFVVFFASQGHAIVVPANSSINLSGSDPDNWMGTSTIFTMSYDPAYDIVLVAPLAGFCAYNFSSNITSNLSGTDTNDWIRSSSILAMAFDSRRNIN